MSNPWVSLTDEEITRLRGNSKLWTTETRHFYEDTYDVTVACEKSSIKFAKAIEAALRSKNNG